MVERHHFDETAMGVAGRIHRITERPDQETAQRTAKVQVAVLDAMEAADHRSMADDAMWATINAHPSYFRDMPPCSGAVEFFVKIRHLDPIILTACPQTNYANAATQKRAWVYEHLGSHVTVLPVMGGHNKPLFMHAPDDVLIDDFERNTRAWAAAGGFSILHRGFDSTLHDLRAVFGEPNSPIEDECSELSPRAGDR